MSLHRKYDVTRRSWLLSHEETPGRYRKLTEDEIAAEWLKSSQQTNGSLNDDSVGGSTSGSTPKLDRTTGGKQLNQEKAKKYGDNPSKTGKDNKKKRKKQVAEDMNHCPSCTCGLDTTHGNAELSSASEKRADGNHIKCVREEASPSSNNLREEKKKRNNFDTTSESSTPNEENTSFHSRTSSTHNPENMSLSSSQNVDVPSMWSDTVENESDTSSQNRILVATDRSETFAKTPESFRLDASLSPNEGKSTSIQKQVVYYGPVFLNSHNVGEGEYIEISGRRMTGTADTGTYVCLDELRKVEIPALSASSPVRHDINDTQRMATCTDQPGLPGASEMKFDTMDDPALQLPTSPERDSKERLTSDAEVEVVWSENGQHFLTGEQSVPVDTLHVSGDQAMMDGNEKYVDISVVNRKIEIPKHDSNAHDDSQGGYSSKGKSFNGEAKKRERKMSGESSTDGRENDSSSDKSDNELEDKIPKGERKSKAKQPDVVIKAENNRGADEDTTHKKININKNDENGDSKDTTAEENRKETDANISYKADTENESRKTDQNNIGYENSKRVERKLSPLESDKCSSPDRLPFKTLHSVQIGPEDVITINLPSDDNRLSSTLSDLTISSTSSDAVGEGSPQQSLESTTWTNAEKQYGKENKIKGSTSSESESSSPDNQRDKRKIENGGSSSSENRLFQKPQRKPQKICRDSLGIMNGKDAYKTWKSDSSLTYALTGDKGGSDGSCHDNSLEQRHDYSRFSPVSTLSFSPTLTTRSTSTGKGHDSRTTDTRYIPLETPSCVPTSPVRPHQGHFVVVAIDFGTTFSGYALSFTRDPESVHMMRNWEGGDPGVINQKTPTTILLTPEGNFDSFGFTARDRYHNLDPQEVSRWLYFEKFKMTLHHNADLTKDTMIQSINGHNFPALTVFSYALRFFKDHALQQLSDQSGITIVNDDVRWVITVPAIWKAPAKQFMRQAAYEAGLVSPDFPDQLLIALEPEAASIYCRRLRMYQLVPEYPIRRPLQSPRRSVPEQLNLDRACSDINEDVSQYTLPFDLPPNLPLESQIKGTRYMVVDCGGGTVDITVHELDHNGKLKELYKATGGPYGALGVDIEFEKLLCGIFGVEFIEHYKQRYPVGWVNLMINFESRKRSASPFKSSSLNVSLPFSFIDYHKKFKGGQIDSTVKKYGDKDICWSSEGMLRLSPDAMKRLFLPTLERIRQAIGDVLNNHNCRDLKFLFLVGGFAESPILQYEIRKEFSGIVKVLIPTGVSLAILKGAVLFGLDPTVVNVRRSRLTYGVGVLNRFDPDRHPQNKLVSRDDVDWCTDVFDKFVVMDQPVTLGDTAVRSYTPAKTGQRLSVINIYCSERIDSQFITDPGVRKCGTLCLDLSDIQLENLPQRREIQARMMFGDTEIKVSALDVTTGRCVRANIDFLNK